MGRGRGKGKKQSFAAALDDIASGEDDKLPARRRGRPLKTLKGKIDEGKTVILEEGHGDNLEGMKSSALNNSSNNHQGDNLEGMKSLALDKSSKNHQTATENGMKRKRPSEVTEDESSVNVHNVIISKTNDNELISVCVGYRPNGSRRKNNKPRRAAEVGLSANGFFCIAH